MKILTVRRLAVVTGLMLSFTTLRAQFLFEPGFSTMLDDNINNNALQIQDKIAAFSLTAGHAWDTARWNAILAYRGNLNYYQNVVDRTNQSHTGSLTVGRTFGDDEEDMLQMGFSFGRGFYRGDYSLYDHALLSASISYKWFLSDRLLGKGGYAFRSMTFSNIPDFNYSEHVFSGSLSVAAAQSTTVIGESEFGSKFYAASGTGSTGRSSGAAVSQLTSGLRIGQGIVEGTGMSLAAKYQWNLQKEMKSLLLTYGSISDDELFDDHYGYEGLHASIMLTQIISESAVLRMTMGTQERLYTSLAAYDVEGSVLADRRSDRRSYIALTLQKSFETGFSLKAAFELIRNKSNDPFYDYSNQALTIQLAFPF